MLSALPLVFRQCQDTEVHVTLRYAMPAGKGGQAHVQRYMKPLLSRIEKGEIDPSRIITHRMPLRQAPHGYDIFKHKKDNCEKVVLKP